MNVALRAAATIALTSLMMAGCGTPAAPQPPSLKLPEPVTDLTAVRAGDQVRLTLDHAQADHRQGHAQGSPAGAHLPSVGTGPCETAADQPFMPDAPADFVDHLPPADPPGHPGSWPILSSCSTMPDTTPAPRIAPLLQPEPPRSASRASPRPRSLKASCSDGIARGRKRNRSHPPRLCSRARRTQILANRRFAAPARTDPRSDRHRQGPGHRPRCRTRPHLSVLRRARRQSSPSTVMSSKSSARPGNHHHRRPRRLPARCAPRASGRRRSRSSRHRSLLGAEH